MEQLGRYLIQEEIGKGGMGIVYRAYDPDIDRNLALKVLRPERAYEWEVTQRFLREAKAAGRLAHPNIVIIYDVGEDAGRAFIAMELLTGEPLNKLIREGKISFEDAIRYAIQIANALHYAHEEGVVHRDIKPSNIIVTGEKQVKITDFGIARVQDVSLAEQTRTGQILGTPSYMAPEQVQGKKVDGRADLFSLGIILYEMISGKKPFEGDNIATLFHSILSTEPEPITEIPEHIKQEVNNILFKVLEKKPENRYQTGKELASDLARILEKKEKTIHVESEKEAEAVESIPGKRKSRAKFIPFVAGLVVILIAAIFIFTGKGHREEVLKDSNKNVIVTTEEIKKAGVDETGKIAFRSDPSGAEVLIDGKVRGKTPMDLEMVPRTYEVKLKMPGYLTWEAQINVEKKQLVPLNITLTPQQGAEKLPGG